jgi:hypothetical protein
MKLRYVRVGKQFWTRATRALGIVVKKHHEFGRTSNESTSEVEVDLLYPKSATPVRLFLQPDLDILEDERWEEE